MPPSRRRREENSTDKKLGHRGQPAHHHHHSRPAGVRRAHRPQTGPRAAPSSPCPRRNNGALARRTRVARLFPNEASLLRLFTTQLAEWGGDWETGKSTSTWNAKTRPQPDARWTYRKHLLRPAGAKRNGSRNCRRSLSQQSPYSIGARRRRDLVEARWDLSANIRFFAARLGPRFWRRSFSACERAAAAA